MQDTSVFLDLSHSCTLLFITIIGLSKVPKVKGNITDLHLNNNLITEMNNLPLTLRILQCKHNKYLTV